MHVELAARTRYSLDYIQMNSPFLNAAGCTEDPAASHSDRSEIAIRARRKT
jgi:hypothetical protein